MCEKQNIYYSIDIILVVSDPCVGQAAILPQVGRVGPMVAHMSEYLTELGLAHARLVLAQA